MTNLIFGSGTALNLWILLTTLAPVLVHVLFAIGVFRDAAQTQLKPPYRGPVLVGAATWALATLIGGVFVAAAYWLVTRSSLRPTDPPAS